MLMNLTTFFTGINLLLILGLMFVYTKNVMKIKTGFTYALLIFGGLFLIQNGVSFYYFITMMPYYANGLDVHVFIQTILQTIAFAVLNVVTWK